MCPFPSTLYRFCFILCYYCVSSVCLDLRQVVLFPSYYVCEIVFHTIAFFRLPHLPPVFCVVSLSSVSISLLLPPSHLCGLWFMSLVTTIFNLQSSRTILLLLLPLCNQAPYPDPPPWLPVSLFDRCENFFDVGLERSVFWKVYTHQAHTRVAV